MMQFEEGFAPRNVTAWTQKAMLYAGICCLEHFMVHMDMSYSAAYRIMREDDHRPMWLAQYVAAYVAGHRTTKIKGGVEAWIATIYRARDKALAEGMPLDRFEQIIGLDPRKRGALLDGRLKFTWSRCGYLAQAYLAGAVPSRDIDLLSYDA